MMQNQTANRIHGLDTLRAAAILLVLMYHYMVVVSASNPFGFFGEIGWTGVDLFFVLSGYLIGNQILSAYAQNRKFPLTTFYIKRLLRTLPNYYFILAMYFLFPLALGGTTAASLWQFLTFTQNLGMRPGETFTHSWSLCIEEQFYLILPIVVIFLFSVITSIKRSIWLAWLVIVAAIVAGMVVRGMAWFDYGHSAITGFDYYQHIYYSSFARFDELLPGVAIALLKNYHTETYTKILRKGNALLVAGLMAVATMFYLLSQFLYTENAGFSFYLTTFGYPLLATSFAILTLAALSPASLLNRIQIPGAASIALWSYAIYLAHKPIFKVLKAPLVKLNIDTASFWGIAIIMTVSILGGWLLYRLIETPFMKLRARLYSTDSANKLGAGLNLSAH
ncbi:acyltransferase family protein [Solimicrobium silvestre]|nr:acyltransferase [Solimicrobium silvestre]